MFITDSIKKIQKINSALNKNMNIISEINSTVMLQIRSLKIKKSDKFKENRFKFRMFLIQTELYINFNVNKFNENQKKNIVSIYLF